MPYVNYWLIMTYGLYWMLMMGFVLFVLYILFGLGKDKDMDDRNDSLSDQMDHENDNHHPFVSPYLTLPLRSIEEAKENRRVRRHRGYPYEVR